MPLLRRVGRGLLGCVATAWFGYQAFYGSGALRIASVVFLFIGAVTASGVVLDRVHPRTRRRRARERDAGG